MRIKTTWFKQDEQPKSYEQNATVIASTIWRLSDTAVINLSKADFDIVTPERGFRIIGELAAFLVHLSDRLAHTRMLAEERAVFVQTIAKRLAEVMEFNVRVVVGEDGYDYQADFIAMLNRRAVDYAAFNFPARAPDFAVLRYLGNCILDIMEERDQHWVVGQIMEVEAPNAIDTIIKSMDGLLGPPESVAS